MKSLALILLAGSVLMASAQARESSRPTKPPVSHFRGSCEPDDEGRKFAAKVCYTSSNPGDNYDPKTGLPNRNKPYVSPACDESKQVTDGQRQVLARMYAVAPDYVKGRLCRLTKFFLTASSGSSSDSWGFWEPPDLSPNGGVFIALSDQYVANDATLAGRKNDVTRALLQAPEDPRIPSFVSSGPPDPSLAALSVAAHELAHVLLADTNADGVNPRHPRRSVSGPPRSRCFESNFVSTSWDANRFHRSMRRWVGFNESAGNRPKNINLRNTMSASDKLRAVYRSGYFVSYFATVSPEEDFNETYTHKVLVDAKASLGIKFPQDDRTMDVLGLVKQPIPAKKIACLRQLGLLSAQP
jgi:hypothetical protein